jgi:hypothetical protein
VRAIVYRALLAVGTATYLGMVLTPVVDNLAINFHSMWLEERTTGDSSSWAAEPDARQGTDSGCHRLSPETLV